MNTKIYERLKSAHYSVEAIRAYEVTGRRTASLACMSHREDEWRGNLKYGGRSGRVDTPDGPGTLINAQNGVARVVLEREDERAREEFIEEHPKSKMPKFVAATRDYPVKEVSPS